MKILTFSGGPFAQNGYVALCPSSGTAVVVDPGATAPQMVAAVHEAGATLAAVLLTHSHLDHVDGVPAVRKAFPGVPIHLHADALSTYEAVPQQAAMFGLPPVPDLPRPDAGFEHGGTFTFGDCSFEVRLAPGHCPGHVILWAAGEGLALVGDVVFAGSIGRTDLPGGDYLELMRSIREQVLTLPDETRLLPGHGPATSVGHERIGNPFIAPQYGGDLA